MSKWTLKRTFVGNPERHLPSDVIGYRSDHVELAEFIDTSGNTKIVEVKEEDARPREHTSRVGPWELVDTYLGDGDTGASSEGLGYSPEHVEIARYINPRGQTKLEVVE